jgi:hypothetical protein
VTVEKPEAEKALENGHGAVSEETAMGDKTGWAPRFGWPATEGDSLLQHSTWLEGQIPDKFYGGAPKPYPTQIMDETDEDVYRLVPQRGRHRFCLHFLVVSRSFRRWSCLGFHNHGRMLHVLPYIHTASAP